MTGTLVSLLKTICDGRLPRSYDYHGVPAPWHQIHILKILSFLGENNQKLIFFLFSFFCLIIF